MADPSETSLNGLLPGARDRLRALVDGRLLRPDIERSWRRAIDSGLEPGVDLSTLSVADIDRQSRLAVAAKPVLDQLSDDFDGTTYCLALADHRARIIERRFGEMQIGTMLDRLGMVPGAEFREENSGTNSIATVVALGKPLTVTGDEHYVDALRNFSCYGHPILNPVTQALEGVLDISCPVGTGNPLIRPLLVRSVREIEQRLLEYACAADQRMLDVYRTATQRRGRPVLVLGDTAVLANPAAMEIFDAVDQAAFRELANSAPAHDRRTHTLVLSSGARVRVEVQRIDGTGRVLFEFERLDEHGPPARRAGFCAPVEDLVRSLEQARTRRLPVLVCGEPGTGRTTLIRELAASHPPAVIEGSDVVNLGEAAWLEKFRNLVAGESLLVVEDLQLVPPAAVRNLLSLLEQDAVWFALTTAPTSQPSGEHAMLMAHCPVRIDLPPLRSRLPELGRLIHDLVRRLCPGSTVRFLPQTVEVLAAHQWPGNLRELENVLRNVLRDRSAGDIIPTDLPLEYRGGIRARRLTTVQQLEHDAIIAALDACRGNKVAAAERLGMSRSTLYRRIRTLGVPDA
jgi:transcriptional regulator of acetoin/glycerol metabolism